MRGCVVIDCGPIRYASIELTGDDDLEAALRGDGLEPDQTTYRLIEVPLETVDVLPMLHRWISEGYAKEAVEALASGVQFPPIVGRAGGDKLVLIDGVHRLVACAAAGNQRVRAYELLG